MSVLRAPHGSLAVLDLRHDARRLESQRVGGSDYVSAAVGALGRDARAVAHRSEQVLHQALHTLPAELTHAVLDELDTVVVGGGQCLVVAGGAVSIDTWYRQAQLISMMLL